MKKQFGVDAIDDRFIETIYRYHYLAAAQLTRLHYRMGSFTTVQERLKRLVDNGYLLTISLPTVKAKGPYIYTLSSKGIAYMKDQGHEAEKSYKRPSEAEEKSYFFLKHTLAINDVLIAASNLTRLEPKISIAEVQHDLVLKHEPCMVNIERKTPDEKIIKETVRLVPDAWVHFSVDRGKGVKPRAACNWFEIDRGTVEVKPFKRRIRGLLTFLNSGAYSKRFGTTSVTVAFATTAGDRRMHQMRKWLDEELSVSNEKPGMYDLFLCTSLPSTIEPKTLFLAPVWFTPNKDNPVPLLLLD